MNHSHHKCKHHLPDHGKRLFWAVLVNVLLTVAQIVGGLVSGSVSLIADAVHNFSDAGALIVAYIAQKISSRPPNQEMTYGYGRAQILGALINSMSLILIGFYLLFEAWTRFLNPVPIDGWTVVAVASLAFVIDVFTAWLTYGGSSENINMRAAFLHNLTDALASLVVIVAGSLIIVFKVYWVDFAATLLISFYIVWHSRGLIRTCIRNLMQAVPESLKLSDVICQMSQVKGVVSLSNVRAWSLSEKEVFLEAIVGVETQNLEDVEAIKLSIKGILLNEFNIKHSTLEFECSSMVDQMKKLE